MDMYLQSQEATKRQVLHDTSVYGIDSKNLYDQAVDAWAYYLTSATAQGRNHSRVSYYNAIAKLADMLGYLDPIDGRFVVLLDVTKEDAQPLAHQLSTEKYR